MAPLPHTVQSQPDLCLWLQFLHSSVISENTPTEVESTSKYTIFMCSLRNLVQDLLLLYQIFPSLVWSLLYNFKFTLSTAENPSLDTDRTAHRPGDLTPPEMTQLAPLRLWTAGAKGEQECKGKGPCTLGAAEVKSPAPIPTVHPLNWKWGSIPREPPWNKALAGVANYLKGQTRWKQEEEN